MIHQQLICEVSSESGINSFSNPSFKSLIISEDKDYLEIKFSKDCLQQLSEIIAHLSRLHQLIQEEKKQEMMSQLKSLNLTFSVPNHTEYSSSAVQDKTKPELPF